MISSRPSPLRLVRRPRFDKWFAGVLSACAAGAALSAHAQFDTFGGDPSTNAFIRIPSDTDDWTRHFRLGALVGINIKANFSENGTFSPSGNNPAAGIFSDGYVVKSPNSPYTSNWGFNNSSQLSGDNLYLHGTSAYSTSQNSSSGNGAFPGLDMAYGGNLWYWKHARVGWEMGFGWLPINISSSSSGPASVDTFTYKYSTGGIVVPTGPGGGYQGSNLGYGPSIPGNPVSEITSTNNSGTVSGTHTLDVDLYTLRLGPSIYWDITERTGISIGAGPAIGLVSGEYKYNETVVSGGVVTQNSGSVSGTDFVFGGYVNAAFMYHLVNNGDIYIGAQYMPMGDATISGGGRSGQLNLNGQTYFSVGINWPF